MGKKSKRDKSYHEQSHSGHTVGPKGNEMYLYRHLLPAVFKSLVDEINPVQRFDAGETWSCIDDDSFVAPTLNESGEIVSQRLKIRQHGTPAECPMCFAPATQKCCKCNSVFYCGADCQKKHWKQCHKKACKPNPHVYHFDVNIGQFRSLSKEAFEGHDFLVIKPTEKLSSLEDICNVCLESADDIFDKIPQFGNDQIQPQWILSNCYHPICKTIQRHFGWTSGLHEIGPLEGYRVCEDKIVYMLMYDDNFLGQTDLTPSYYGDACFSYARENKLVRGNLVIFKILVKNKKRMERDSSGYDVVLIQSDDTDLIYEYEMYPISKAEIAHILQERRNAIEQGRYTRRQWRYNTRREERRIEATAKERKDTGKSQLKMSYV